MNVTALRLLRKQFPDFKDLNVFALMYVPLPKALQSKHNYINDNQESLQFLNMRVTFFA